MARLSCISSLAPYTTWLYYRKPLKRNLLIRLPSSSSTAPTLSIASRGSNFQQSYLLKGCEERLRSASASPAQAASQPQPNGWNLLWKFIASHYGCHGLLKLFHSGTVTDINSESGVQQGDPLGSTLFALAIHPVLLDLGRSFPSLLITAYADNVIFAGPLSVLRDAHDRYSEQMQAICLRVNSCKSAVFVPQWQHWQVDTYEHILARPEVQQHLFQAAQAPVTSFPCRVAPRSPSLETASQSLAHQLEPQRTA